MTLLKFWKITKTKMLNKLFDPAVCYMRLNKRTKMNSFGHNNTVTTLHGSGLAKRDQAVRLIIYFTDF